MKGLAMNEDPHCGSLTSSMSQTMTLSKNYSKPMLQRVSTSVWVVGCNSCINVNMLVLGSNGSKGNNMRRIKGKHYFGHPCH